MKRWIGFVFGAVLGFGALVPQAGAVFTGGELNEIDFTNRENIFDAATTAPKSPSIGLPYFGLGIGDHIAGILRVELIDGPSGATFLNDVSAPIDQITGAYAQRIIGLGGFPGLPSLGVGGAPGAFGPSIVFGNPTTFTFVDPATAGTFTVPLAAGEMFAFYRDTGLTVVDPIGLGTMTGSHAISTDGTKILTLGLDATDGLGGIDGLPGTADDTGYVYSILTTPATGSQLAGLGIKYNIVVPGPVVPIVDPAEILLTFSRGFPLPVDLFFSAEFGPNPLFAGFGNLDPTKSAWGFESDDPARVFPVIPEVSSLWMLGMGLSGLGVFRRRKLLG